MKKIALYFVLLTIPVCFLFGQKAKVLINLSEVKQQIYEYYLSGDYFKEVDKSINEGLRNLSNINIPENAAFVFDIDETALSNWDYQINNDFGYNNKLWDTWIDSAKAPPILPVKRFYDSLIAKNVKILFLTGRNQNQFKKTYDNLVKAGYTIFDTLICRSPHEGKTALEYKSLQRKNLSSKYKIIGSIGDQWSDLDGGFAMIKVKTPNYIYIIE